MTVSHRAVRGTTSYCFGSRLVYFAATMARVFQGLETRQRPCQRFSDDISCNRMDARHRKMGSQRWAESCTGTLRTGSRQQRRHDQTIARTKHCRSNLGMQGSCMYYPVSTSAPRDSGYAVIRQPALTLTLSSCPRPRGRTGPCAHPPPPETRTWRNTVATPFPRCELRGRWRD